VRDALCSTVNNGVQDHYCARSLYHASLRDFSVQYLKLLKIVHISAHGKTSSASSENGHHIAICVNRGTSVMSLIVSK